MLVTKRKYEKKKEEEIKLMDSKPKSYTGPATEFNDPVEGPKIRER
jgi:hypothetical protein